MPRNVRSLTRLLRLTSYAVKAGRVAPSGYGAVNLVVRSEGGRAVVGKGGCSPNQIGDGF